MLLGTRSPPDPCEKVFDWFSGSGIARISDQELSKLDITFATRWGSGCFHMLEICALFYYKIFIWGIFHKQLNTWCELVLAAGRRTQISLDATWTHSRVYVARGLTQWRFIAMQIEDEAAQREDEQLRAVAQMRCPETLLPPLVQASRR